MMPATFSQRLSRPSRQAAQRPHVMAPYITTLSPTLKFVLPAPTAAISPEASAPTTKGSWRLANAIPRNPHRSRCLSVAARRRRRWDVGEFKFPIGNQLERTHGGLACPALGRLKPHHQRNVLSAKAE